MAPWDKADYRGEHVLGEEDTSIEKILKNMNYSINHSVM